ncbi:RNA polymerase II degradation factor 1 [Drosophila novamexicana]|uniref:RNA polymerase II degradation factor 1 n=1 Tax=Drosophila novamexicana TaxID=47314 RepID=UPI0011E5EEC6|nr:RNA polymerase II degradation factor 1 [Drosophila novamexicana]
MASCDVQATPSDDNIEEDTAEAETQTESVNKFEARTTKNGTVPQPTKIPGPVRLDNTGSYIHTSTRKYTSLMKSLQTKGEHDDSFSSTSTLVNTAEDSGIQMDCSTVETDEMNAYSDIPCQPSSSTPRLQRSTDTVAISGSLQELEEAEQQTLRVLQRAVAEMEADVALHAELLEEQMKLELENQQKLQFEEDVQQEFKKTLLPETVEEQKQQQQPDHKQLKLQPEQQTPSIHARAGVRERKHVRVEQLLEAEHDIELLHKLLQVDEGEQLAHGELNNALAQPSEKLCLPDLNAGKDMEDLDRCATDSAAAEFNRKHISLLHSLLHIICGKGIRKLSYPILFCGMAVGLIYYFRKD